MTNSKSLFEIQSLFQSAVQDGLAPQELVTEVIEKPPISVAERLKIYQDAYYIRLIESLRDDFADFEEALGSEKFELIAREYIQNTPSRFQNLAEYSEGFIVFVQNSNPNLEGFVLKNWHEILSSSARDPEDGLSLEQIQAGQEFKIKIFPATFDYCFQGQIKIIYRSSNEIKNDGLSTDQYLLLQFLKSEKSLDEITNYAKDINMTDDFVTTTLHEWIKNQIIYCKQK